MNPYLRILLSPIYGGDLAPDHRANLIESGIAEALRCEQGVRSVPPSDFKRLLGFEVPAAVRSLMLLPYPDPAGSYFDAFQCKLFPALKDAAGHTVKYLQPRGSVPRLYFVRRVVSRVMDPAVPLFLVEGAKKAMAAAQLGQAAVGFGGIESWHRSGSQELLADFDGLPLEGRVVDLCPDGDAVTNPAVARGAARFARALKARGANVRMVEVPLREAA